LLGDEAKRLVFTQPRSTPKPFASEAESPELGGGGMEMQVVEKVAAMEATVAPLAAQLAALRDTLDTAVLPSLTAELGAHAAAQAQQAAAQVAAASAALSELAVLLPGVSLLFGPSVRASLRAPAAAGRAVRVTDAAAALLYTPASHVPSTASAMAALPPFKGEARSARHTPASLAECQHALLDCAVLW
jgi:hypothetical protein